MAGDEPAFESLHRRIGPGLRRMLSQRLRTGSEAELDDLCQRVWVGIWRALRAGTYDPTRAAFTTFAYAVAYRTWLYHLRQTTVAADRHADIDLDESVAGSSESPEAAGEFAQLLEAVRLILRGESTESLPAEDRAMLRSIAEGESDRALASRLGLSPSTANARKQAALGKVRRLLARLGFAADSGERDDLPRKQPDAGRTDPDRTGDGRAGRGARTRGQP